MAGPPFVIAALSAVACAHVAPPLAESPANEAEPTNLSNRDNSELSGIAQAEEHAAADMMNAPLPRRQSISLGESYVPPRWLFPYSVAMAPMPPSVVINNYNTVHVSSPGYGGVVSPYYYPSTVYQTPYAWRSSGSSPGFGTATSNGSPRIGGDWPVVPSYGPKMLSHIAPGAVWAR